MMLSSEEAGEGRRRRENVEVQLVVLRDETKKPKVAVAPLMGEAGESQIEQGGR